MLQLKNIKKSYKTKDFVQHALNGVSIAFRKNEFASILGASGSGKTTMLNIIGGLDQYDSGDLLIDGVSTKNYKSTSWDTYRNNRVGFVFQSYNLIPHQTVLSNVELALTLSGVSKKERKERAIEALKNVGLEDHIYKRPTQLSGGQMQRVAIARALINDPEIVLADEPTGALDSETSDQVMALLESIAKDRLVIMVTHNPELAHRYTNRIIELKDGSIISDSNPYINLPDKLQEEGKVKRTSMSFFTAISLSISNLMTKKARTFITSLAGSIGIIGIAAILSLASGINLYIESIEQETMSAYPLTLDTSGIDISSFMGSMMQEDKEKEAGKLPVLNSIDTMFSSQNQNDLKSLKTYMDNNASLIDPYVKNIQFKYGITPQIYLKEGSFKTRQVNPDTIFSRYGLGEMSGLEMIAGGAEMGMKSFNELPGDASLFESQYDVVKGRWPQNKNEGVVVLMDQGSLSDITMYALGLKDRDTLNSMFEDFFSDENTQIESEAHDAISYDDVLGAQFKIVQQAAQYQYDENYNIWVDKSNDAKYMNKVIDEGMGFEIVGIVQASPSTKTPMLTSGIYYTQDLVTHLIKDAKNYDVVKAQLENEKLNVFTNKTFDDENNMEAEDIFAFDNFVSIDENALKNAFKMNDLDMDLNFSFDELKLEDIKLPELNLEDIASSIASQINLPTEEVNTLMIEILTDFVETQNPEDLEDLETLANNLNLYLQDEKVQAKIQKSLESLGQSAEISKNITDIINNSISQLMLEGMNELTKTLENSIKSQMASLMNSLPQQFENAVEVDADMLASAFQFNMDEQDMIQLISSLTDQTQSTQKANLKRLGYRDLDDPTQINLYPKDFSTKDAVIDFIADYNQKMVDDHDEAKVVKYTDFVGAMMSSVTTIINTISYALIAFVAISLIVSSIMIGVITYVSVLERIKEIGILRAIGASKKDIRRVFNAETLIVGFVAGALGIVITYVIAHIASIIVLDKFGIPNIAHLEIKAAVILMLISMFLAVVAGLIPSSSAANKDPVEALRSE